MKQRSERIASGGLPQLCPDIGTAVSVVLAMRSSHPPPRALI